MYVSTDEDRNDAATYQYAMTQQMLFTRSVGNWQQSPAVPSIKESCSSPQRAVSFAVPSELPSPVVYQSQMQSGYPTDRSKELPRRQQQVPAQRKTQRNASATKTIGLKPQSKKPAWDAEVSHNTTLFDASLKKSLLFQPQAGTRWQEDEKQTLASKQALKTRKKARTRSLPVRYRSGPSSVYAQQRLSVQHWPKRKTKDFIRQNIEHLTGQTVIRHSEQNRRRSNSRKNVFERLSTSLVSRPVLKSHALDESARSEPGPRSARSPTNSSLVSLQAATTQPSALRIDSPAPDKLEASSRCLSFQQSQHFVSSCLSPTSQSTNTNRVKRTSLQFQHDNYPARVFKVLDRENEKRIGVDQILQGLRLLSLPATHNQISDYVYLIHEGHYDSIDLEEWEILVGTLDAASRPSADSPRKAHACLENAAMSHSHSIHNNCSRSPNSSMPLSTLPYSRKHPSTRLPTNPDESASVAKTHTSQARFSTSIQRESIISADRVPISDDDPYLKEIQNRIEEMFKKAQEAAALRWAPEPANDQFEDHFDNSRSNRALKRAATVVYSLRASLFPLVQQAETTLRELQQRHGSKLSLFLPPRDMAAIAQNSDILAAAILDDILLDTVQLLNEEDKQKSRQQQQIHHADQLDDILNRIQKIEQEENHVIHQGLALECQPAGIKSDLQTALLQSNHAKASQPESATPPNLTLPLEAVMNVSIPDDDDNQPLLVNVPGVAVEHQTTDKYDNESILFETPSPQTARQRAPVNTSILQDKRLQSIERKRHKFMHHRRLVESSLAGTGMTQCAVIEILEEMLMNDLIEQIAVELSDTVLSMSDTLLTNLL